MMIRRLMRPVLCETLKKKKQPSVVVTDNPSTWETET
jgi:hypothetical protein